MTKDDIIRMAREAGAVFPADGSYHCFEIPDTLERFAALVAAHEREECAKVIDQEVERVKPLYSVVAENAAKAIRAKNTP